MRVLPIATPSMRSRGSPAIGQPSGKCILSKELIEAGFKPVGKRRLFKIANAVDLQRDPVAALRHMLRGLCV